MGKQRPYLDCTLVRSQYIGYRLQDVRVPDRLSAPKGIGRRKSFKRGCTVGAVRVDSDSRSMPSAVDLNRERIASSGCKVFKSHMPSKKGGDIKMSPPRKENKYDLSCFLHPGYDASSDRPINGPGQPKGSFRQLQLRHKMPRATQPVDAPEDVSDVDADGAVEVLVEVDLVTQGLVVAIEGETDQFPVSVEHR